LALSVFRKGAAVVHW